MYANTNATIAIKIDSTIISPNTCGFHLIILLVRYIAITKITPKNAKVIYLSPKGKVLNQSKVKELSKEKHLILLCGHYEGIDQRVLDEIVDEEISIGDYVLTRWRVTSNGTHRQC